MDYFAAPNASLTVKSASSLIAAKPVALASSSIGRNRSVLLVLLIAKSVLSFPVLNVWKDIISMELLAFVASQSCPIALDAILRPIVRHVKVAFILDLVKVAVFHVPLQLVFVLPALVQLDVRFVLRDFTRQISQEHVLCALLTCLNAVVESLEIARFVFLIQAAEPVKLVFTSLSTLLSLTTA